MGVPSTGLIANSSVRASCWEASVLATPMQDVKKTERARMRMNETQFDVMTVPAALVARDGGVNLTRPSVYPAQKIRDTGKALLGHRECSLCAANPVMADHDVLGMLV